MTIDATGCKTYSVKASAPEMDASGLISSSKGAHFVGYAFDNFLAGQGIPWGILWLSDNRQDDFLVLWGLVKSNDVNPRSTGAPGWWLNNQPFCHLLEWPRNHANLNTRQIKLFSTIHQVTLSDFLMDHQPQHWAGDPQKLVANMLKKYASDLSLPPETQLQSRRPNGAIFHAEIRAHNFLDRTAFDMRMRVGLR